MLHAPPPQSHNLASFICSLRDVIYPGFHDLFILFYSGETELGCNIQELHIASHPADDSVFFFGVFFPVTACALRMKNPREAQLLAIRERERASLAS